MILYIGNKLSKHGNTLTSVEILGNLLSQEMDIVSISSKQNKLLRMADMLYSIVKYRKQTRFILIDTYSTSNFYYALFSAVLAKYFNISYIPILHGGNLERRLKYSSRMSKFLFSNAYMNIAPSGYLQYIFKKYGFEVEFIPNNIEIDNYIFKKRKSFRPKLLYVRAFSPIYNPSMALYVFEALLKKYEDAELCMVGPDRDGTLKRTKELCYEMCLEDKVLFTGKLSKKEWWKLSEKYDIFINTTNFDNTPVSVMEGMALGLAVVSTNVGGIPYLLEDKKDALLVDAKDDSMMVRKIEELIENNKKTIDIVYEARKKVECFDWKVVKKQWMELLREDSYDL